MLHTGFYPFEVIEIISNHNTVDTQLKAVEDNTFLARVWPCRHRDVRKVAEPEWFQHAWRRQRLCLMDIAHSRTVDVYTHLRKCYPQRNRNNFYVADVSFLNDTFTHLENFTSWILSSHYWYHSLRWTPIAPVLNNVVCGSQRQRLNGGRRVDSGWSHEQAAIHDE